MTEFQNSDGDRAGERTQPTPEPSRSRRLFQLIRIPLLTYLGVLLLVTIFQRRLIYHPATAGAIEISDSPFSAERARTVTVTTSDGLVLRGWHVLPNNASPDRTAVFRQLAEDSALNTGQEAGGTAFDGTSVVVLYFCGNGGHRAYRDDSIRLLTNCGADVVIFDYRGYGDNPGTPAAEDIARDVRVQWDWLTGQEQVPAGKIVLFGESLGGGVAVRLAEEVCADDAPPAGLILRSTFSSLASVGGVHFPWLPVRWLLRERFDSAARLPQVTCPLLQIHGDSDDIVPLSEGRLLATHAARTSASGIPPEFLTLPGVGHNNVTSMARREVRQAVQQFLQRLDLAESDEESSVE